MSTNNATDLSNLESAIGLAGIPGEGPHMAIVLYSAGNLIHEARFSTYGCPAGQSCGQSCGQFVCDKVGGGSLEAAAGLDEAAILAGVGHMPLGREHGPRLAIGALRDALGMVAGAA